MKNYQNRLKAIERIADGKSARVIFVDYKNGKYYKSGTDIEVDINTVKASAIIVDNIPDTPPEFLEKGSEEDWQENEYQMKR